MRMKLKTSKGGKINISPSNEKEVLKIIAKEKNFCDDLKMFKESMKE